MAKEKFRNTILKQRIKSVSSSINRWKITETSVSISGEMFTVAAGLLAFSVTYFDNTFLSYLSGAFGFCGIGCRQFSSYCYRKGQSAEKVLDSLLVANGEDAVPDVITPPSTEESTSSNA